MSDGPVSWAWHDGSNADGVLSWGDKSNAEGPIAELYDNRDGDDGYYQERAQAWNVGDSYSYGYETPHQEERSEWGAHAGGHEPAGSRAAAGGTVQEQDESGMGVAVDQWHWVEDPSGQGYYYNVVSGEARWDDPAAFEGANSEALVECGYQDVSNGEVDQSTLESGYGVETFMFTADDGTVWRYDETAGDYVRNHNEESAENAGDQAFSLNNNTESPWQRVESEYGPYFYNVITEESSWDQPPDWQAGWPAEATAHPEVSPSAWGVDATATYPHDAWTDSGMPRQQTKTDGFMISAPTGQDEAGFAPGHDATDFSGPALVLRGGSDGMVSADTGVAAYTQSATTAPGEQQSRLNTAGDTGSGGSCDLGGGRDASVQSGDGRCLDQTSTGEVDQWSMEKLHEVSKMLPEKWFVSDFLLDRATEDYAKLLELDEAEIEAIKNKGTSQLIRSLVGPVDGEDSDDEDVDLPSDEEADETERSEHPSDPAGADKKPGAHAGSSTGSDDKSGPAEIAAAERALPKIGGRGSFRGGSTPGIRCGAPGRKLSLLGLEQACAEPADGLGQWKPGFALDGSVYFVHQVTGESAWTFPVRAWEVKARQLSLLTPRTPLELGRGVCRLRETEEMRKKRLSHRWKMKMEKDKETIRRRDNPTPEEAAKDAIEEIISTAEARDERERRVAEHEIRSAKRRYWHPSTSGHLMKRLVLSASTTAIMHSANASGMEVEPKTIITDADFFDMKLTQAGSAIPWGPEISDEAPAAPTTKTRPAVKRRLARLRFNLPVFFQGLRAHPPARLPKMPSLKAMPSVQSMESLKHDLTAAVATVGRKRKSAELRWSQATSNARDMSGGNESVAKSMDSEEAEVASAKGTPRALILAALDALGDSSAIAATTSSKTDRPAAQGHGIKPELVGGGSIPQGSPTIASDARDPLREKKDDSYVSIDAGVAAPAHTFSPEIVVAVGELEEGAEAHLKRGQRENDGSAVDGELMSPPLPPSSRLGRIASAAPSSAPSMQGPILTGSSMAPSAVEEGSWQRGGGERKQEEMYQLVRDGNHTSSVALAGVAPLDEKIGGIRAKLALKIETGTLIPRVGLLDGATTAAKRVLTKAGMTTGFHEQLKDKSTKQVREATRTQLPPPDTSTVTLRLSCKPPPFNLLTSVRVKDPVTGKDYNREELTSVLRDTWENMIIQDVATAGGVSTRQVVIEEVRQEEGPFPLGISHRHNRSSTSGDGQCFSLSAAIPFRAEQPDGIDRVVTATTPTFATTAEGAYITARNDRSIPVPHAGRSGPANLRNHSTSKTAQEIPCVGEDRIRDDNGGVFSTTAPRGPTFRSIPQAGLSATLARRFRGPRIKTWRASLKRSVRGGSPYEDEAAGSALQDVFSGRGERLGRAASASSHDRCIEGGATRRLSCDAISLAAEDNTPGTTRPIASGQNAGQPHASSQRGEDTTKGSMVAVDHAEFLRSGIAHRNDGDGSSHLRKGDTTAPCEDNQRRKYRASPRRLGSSPPTPSAASRKMDGGSGPSAIADGTAGLLSPHNSSGLTSEKELMEGKRGENRTREARLEGEGLRGANGAAAGDVGVWKGMRFADKTTADYVHVGIGAGNRGDWGVVGRTQQRSRPLLAHLHGVENMLFLPAEGERTQDPKVLEALGTELRQHPHMSSWQAKDNVMKALDPSQRIPTMHELKLAGRVERARALFGSGGFLPATRLGGEGPTAASQKTKHRPFSGNTEEDGDPQSLWKGNIKRGGQGETAAGTVRSGGEGENNPHVSLDSLNRSSRSPAKTMDQDSNVDGNKAPGATVAGETQQPQPKQGPPGRVQVDKNLRGDKEGDSDSSSHTAGKNDRVRSMASSLEMRSGNDPDRTSLPPTSLENTKNTSIPPSATKPNEGRGFPIGGSEFTGTARAAVLGTGGLTTVTLTIVGGRPGSHVFTNLKRKGKTPSESVAQSVALQMAVEGSDLLRGGLTHRAVSASWCPAGRGRVMESWEGYWCHAISPVFFGRSVRSRHLTKADARRRREADARRHQQRHDRKMRDAAAVAAEGVAGGGGDSPQGSEVSPTGERGEGIAEKMESTALVSARSGTSSVRTPRWMMSPNELLEEAEIKFQELLAEGLADGRRMNSKQYRAMTARDRAIKKVLLRRKITAKRKGGGMSRPRFPCRHITAEEIRLWKAEIEKEDQDRREKRRAQTAAQHENRHKETKKRGKRNQLKSWLLRQLVENNGHADLMTMAISLEHQENNSTSRVDTAGRGAPGRESSMSGRNSRPGGRFAYQEEVTADHMQKRYTVKKAQQRFEKETDALLRDTFRIVHASLEARSPSPRRSRKSSTSTVNENHVARLSRPAQQPGNNDLPGRSVAVAAVAKTSSKPSSVVGDDHAGSGTDDATLAAEVGGEQEKSTDEAPAIAAVSVVVGAAPSASSPSAEGPSVTTTPVTPVTAAPPVDGSASTAVNAPEHASNLSGISALKPKLLEDAVNAAAEGRGRDGNNSPESLPREQAAATVPRSAWLRVLRQAGSLRRKAMASDALRPILTDGDFTKAFLTHPGSAEGVLTEDELALFGSVVAEVDRWYKRVRATLDPVKARAEARVKSFESRKKRGQAIKAREKHAEDGLAPSDRWRRELKVSRIANRGKDGRDWSRFHHHVFIQASPSLPLYCCVCRRWKWDEARVARLKEEHAFRTTWEVFLSEKQELLESVVQVEVRAALQADRALCDMDAGSWAVQHCLESLISAVPGRAESMDAASDVLDTVMERVMRASFSLEERTRKRRLAALAKLRALEGFQAKRGGSSPSRGRRRSRRVSVGPSGFGVAQMGKVAASTLGVTKEVSSLQLKDGNGVATAPVSEPLDASVGGGITAEKVLDQKLGAVAVAAGMEGATTGSIGRAGRRSLSEFGELAQAVARTYYNAPGGFLLAKIRATAAWGGLRNIWFQKEAFEGEGLDEEKRLSFTACVVEVLDGETETWERQERERRGMFAEDESHRRDDETLRRAAESIGRERQETGHRAFCATIGTMERKSQSLARLRWEVTIDLGDMQDMTNRVIDASTGKRYICRILPCRGQDEVEVVLKEAYRIQEIRNPSLVKIHSAHLHRIATYDERGVQTTGGAVVLLLVEFCPGGALQDHTSLAAKRSNAATAPGGGADHPRIDVNHHDSNQDALSQTRRMCASEMVVTPGAKQDEGANTMDNHINCYCTDTGGIGEGKPREATCARAGGWQAPVPEGVPARRLEGWIRQVAHGLSALHAESGMHRNISAGAVFLDEKGRAKLGDYQCLKVSLRNCPGPLGTHEGFGCATTVPPEFELRGETSPKGDVWSLGCALYKWTTGKEFAYVAAGARLQDIIHLVPPSYGDKIKTALFMCLQRDPEVRVSSLDLWKFMSAGGGPNNSDSVHPAVAQ